MFLTSYYTSTMRNFKVAEADIKKVRDLLKAVENRAGGLPRFLAFEVHSRVVETLRLLVARAGSATSHVTNVDDLIEYLQELVSTGYTDISRTSGITISNSIFDTALKDATEIHRVALGAIVAAYGTLDDRIRQFKILQIIERGWKDIDNDILEIVSVMWDVPGFIETLKRDYEADKDVLGDPEKIVEQLGKDIASLEKQA